MLSIMGFLSCLCKQDTWLDGHWSACCGYSHISVESCSSSLNNWLIPPYIPFGILHLEKPNSWALSLPKCQGKSGLPSSVSHTPLPLAAEAWGSSRTCSLGRFHSCLAGLAVAAARLRTGKGRCCVELAGVLSSSFSSLLLFPSLYGAEPQHCLLCQAKGLALLSTQICYLCSDSKALSHDTEYPMGRAVAQK